MTQAHLRLDRRRALSLFTAALLAPTIHASGQVAPPPPPPPGPSGLARQEIPETADPSITPPAFDVVSIKPNKSGGGGIRVMLLADGYSANNIPLKFVISNAYGIKDDLIFGGPGWVDSARFDVNAKVAPADVDTFKKLTIAQRNAMLQPLLTDRFKLQAHVETKNLPIYELVLGKGGSKLHEAVPGDTYDSAPKVNGNSPRAGMMMMSPGKLTGMSIPIANLITILSRQLQRTIVDKTSLTGKYDITLQWTPEQGEGMGFPGGAGAPPPPPDSAGPSIFTAIEEQLGLKLNSTKGPVQTLAIDHIDPPTED